MLEWLPKLEKVPGEREEKTVVMLALSTCGFCRKGMDYLKDKGLTFHYCHLDYLEPERKAELKEQYKSNFGKVLTYPTLIVNDKEILTGFSPSQWDEMFQ